LVQRAHELLDLNSQDQLTPEQRNEMLEFARADDVIALLKSKTKLKLQS